MRPSVAAVKVLNKHNIWDVKEKELGMHIPKTKATGGAIANNNNNNASEAAEAGERGGVKKNTESQDQQTLSAALVDKIFDQTSSSTDGSSGSGDIGALKSTVMFKKEVEEEESPYMAKFLINPAIEFAQKQQQSFMHRYVAFKQQQHFQQQQQQAGGGGGGVTTLNGSTTATGQEVPLSIDPTTTTTNIAAEVTVTAATTTSTTQDITTGVQTLSVAVTVADGAGQAASAIPLSSPLLASRSDDPAGLDQSANSNDSSGSNTQK